ncbi:MAG: ABC transporter permease [Bacteroidia bacterium]|nr:ABC transporter permease [Bacteroidia bacterium]
MSKIGLIISREYITRVRKKSFIIMTLLGPLLMGGLLAAVAYMAINSNDNVSVIQVVDQTPNQIISSKLVSTATLIYINTTTSVDSLRAHFDSDKTYGILHIPANLTNDQSNINFYTEKKANLSVVSAIEKDLQKQLEAAKLRNAGIDPVILASIKTDVSIKQKTISGTEESNAEASAIIGFGGGLLIYLFVFIYGVQVMRGVMEEKQNRIVEVIMSSVKPFELMMGKILGIALVAFTQFVLWIILTFVVSSVATTAVSKLNPQASATMVEMQKNQLGASPLAQTQPQTPVNDSLDISKMISSYNLPKMLLMFLFYFVGGYLLYSALFAAIGAAVDSETDVQQFMIPITIPLIFAYVASTIVMQNPDSSMGFWFSIIPLTSPIVMMVRIPFDPPMLDIVLSMVLLVAGFIGTTWLAGKIYRTGILMYGKKITYKELFKWLSYK